MTKLDNNIDGQEGKSSLNCGYLLPHKRDSEGEEAQLKCLCPLDEKLNSCKCTRLSQRWAKESFAKRHRHPHKRTLVAYLRPSDSNTSIAEQIKIINDYCQDNEYYVKDYFTDYGKPGAALQSALEAMQNADGLIASDLNRFVEHYDDRQRDLKPFVHHFFCAPSKHLISVEEGIDTGSAAGQSNAIEVISQVK